MGPGCTTFPPSGEGFWPFLLVYEAALLLVPVPGVGQGVYREEANLMRHLNATYLAPLDLRGVFSTIPTGALVLFGTLVGEALGRGGRGVYPLAWAALVLGLALRLGLPYDKTYWTPPYILVTAGVGTMLLGLLRGLASRPLFGLKAVQALGANPLPAYLLPVAFKVGVLTRVRVGQEPLQDLLLSHLTRAFGPVWGGGPSPWGISASGGGSCTCSTGRGFS